MSPSASADPLDDFDREAFSHDGVTRPVFRVGRGPGVVLIHEIPGITPETARLARRIAAHGFTVLLPSLLGTPGAPFTGRDTAAQIARLCVAGEFAALAGRREGPIVDWLRALCRAAHAELGGPGVGAIGMCFSGNFAIALMADPHVVAPVTSQPSLPVPSVGARARELAVADDTLVQIKRRAASGGKLLGMRFTGDPLCPAARFVRLREELGEAFESIEIDSGLLNRHGLRRLAHSVLTLDLVDRAGHPTRAALDRVLAFLRERLAPAGPTA